MHKITRTFLILGTPALLAACGVNVANRERPDEFAVQRQAPLVIPPSFDLVPPAPGAPRPTEGTAAEQAMQALFGDGERSVSEADTLRAAGDPEISIRATVGDPATNVVDKGNATRTILAAPEGDGQAARTNIPS